MAFYLTLPSTSSSEYFANNTAGHFYSKLPQTFDLEGEYEIGLSEIQFSNTFENIKEDECHMEITVGKVIEIRIKPGLFPDNDNFIKYLNTRLKSNNVLDHCKFTYASYSRKVTLHTRNKSQMKLSPTLARVLGFSQTEFLKGERHVAPTIMDLNTDFHSVFVYCDLSSQTPVGPVLAPLLRIVPVLNKNADVTHYIFEKPHFVPLSRNQFNTVEILLKNHLGQTFSFSSGQSIVTLQIQPRQK